MNREQILALSSMPAAAPSYPLGPYHFVDRTYMIITYQTDKAAIERALPAPLEPEDDLVAMQWIDMPDGSGFGSYCATALSIPCLLVGKPCVFISQMYLNNAPPMAAGREIWGYPMKFGDPSLQVTSDTLTGKLVYAGERVATGTMAYKHEDKAQDPGQAADMLARTQVNLKLIPDVDGSPAIAQLVGYEFESIRVKGAWTGDARLHVTPHVNAPLADLPVREVIRGRHIVTDLTLPHGRVLHDYIKDG